MSRTGLTLRRRCLKAVAALRSAADSISWFRSCRQVLGHKDYSIARTLSQACFSPPHHRAVGNAVGAREALPLVSYRMHPDAQQPAHGGHVQLDGAPGRAVPQPYRQPPQGRGACPHQRAGCAGEGRERGHVMSCTYICPTCLARQGRRWAGKWSARRLGDV